MRQASAIPGTGPPRRDDPAYPVSAALRRRRPSRTERGAVPAFMLSPLRAFHPTVAPHADVRTRQERRASMAGFEMATLSVEAQYKLMSGSVIPRPIEIGRASSRERV